VTPLPSRLLVVTDRHLASRDLPALIEEAVSAGARWIWFRDKDLERRARLALARQVHAAIAGRATLTIGADIDLARELGVKAVHLSMSADLSSARRQLGDDAFIGLSAHSLSDVAQAKIEGADYVTLSPIFLTSSKPGYGPAIGLSCLNAAAALDVPVLALGGVCPMNVQSILDARAAGVAVMGKIMQAHGIRAKVATYLSSLEEVPRTARAGLTD
jgi:thiamine-phosphate pyrophosphorylase